MTQDAGNPDPDRIRRWHIANPYDGVQCDECGRLIGTGELVNIEFERGVMHAPCSDGEAPPAPPPPAPAG